MKRLWLLVLFVLVLTVPAYAAPLTADTEVYVQGDASTWRLDLTNTLVYSFNPTLDLGLILTAREEPAGLNYPVEGFLAWNLQKSTLTFGAYAEYQKHPTYYASWRYPW